MKRLVMRCTVTAMLVACLCACDISGVKPPEPPADLPTGQVGSASDTEASDAPIPELVGTTYVLVEAQYGDGHSEVLVTEDTTPPWDLYLRCPASASAVRIVGYVFLNKSERISFYFRTEDGQVYYDGISSQSVNKQQTDGVQDVEAEYVLRYELIVPTELLNEGFNEVYLHADADGHQLDGWIVFEQLQIELYSE